MAAGLSIIGLIGCFVGLLVWYFVTRAAVHHGVRDALNERDNRGISNVETPSGDQDTII